MSSERLKETWFNKLFWFQCVFLVTTVLADISFAAASPPTISRVYGGEMEDIGGLPICLVQFPFGMILFIIHGTTLAWNWDIPDKEGGPSVKQKLAAILALSLDLGLPIASYWVFFA